MYCELCAVAKLMVRLSCVLPRTEPPAGVTHVPPLST